LSVKCGFANINVICSVSLSAFSKYAAQAFVTDIDLMIFCEALQVDLTDILDFHNK